MKMKWYEDDKNRYLEEIRAIRKIYPLSKIHISRNNTIIWITEIEIFNSKRFLILEFPETYPYSPPFLWESDQNITKFKDHSETTHQNRNNSICLYTSDGGPDSWHFDNLAVDVVSRFKYFLKMEKKGKHVDEHTSIEHDVLGILKKEEIIIPISELKVIESRGSCGELKLYKFMDDRPLKILTLSDSTLLISEFPWKKYKLSTDSKLSNGVFIKLNILKKEYREFIKKFSNMDDFIKKYKIDSKKYNFIFLLFNDSKIPNSQTVKPTDFDTHISYIIDIKNFDINFNEIPIYKVYSIDIPDECFQRTQGILENVIEEIKQKKVMIIGAGTLGSIISLELVQTGVKNFVIYDMDTFQAVNICRHIGDIMDLGKYKSQILKEKIICKNPDAKIRTYNTNPFLNNETIQDFITELHSTHTIVITTADYYSEQILNKLSVKYNKTVIYGWCGSNANQGRIFRVIPSKTPCYNCINIQTEKFPEIYPTIKPISLGSELPQFVGYRQPGIPGISIDVNFIALFISKLALETLLINNQEYPNSLADHYIWQNNPTDLSSDAISAIPFNFKRIEYCSICSSNSNS